MPIVRPPSPAMTSPRPSVLYHYTDAAGLLGIVETRTLRATHARFLNDAREIDKGVDVVLNDLSRQVSRPFDEAERSMLDDVVRTVRDSRDQPVWVASLSELGDDLNQWRAYSPQGGYAIGFDHAALSRSLQATGFKLNGCWYGEAWMGDALSSVAQISRFLEKLDNVARPQLRHENEQRRQQGRPELTYAELLRQQFDMASRLATSVLWDAVSVKDESFWAEREWRAIRVDDPGFSACKFRVRRDTLIPYVEVPLGDGLLPIVSIRSSPGMAPATRASLTLFLAAYSDRLTDVAIEAAASPYRTV